MYKIESNYLKDVSYITSATLSDFSDVKEWKKKSVEDLQELNEDLAFFTGVGNEANVKD